MVREIHDEDYLNYLPTELHRGRYRRWRKRMLDNLDTIVTTFQTLPRDEAIEKLELTPRDIALLVRLDYLTHDEATAFNLWEIEVKVPE